MRTLVEALPQALTETPRPHWPDAVAYREAVQEPVSALPDPVLRNARVACDARGLPLTFAGRFAVVFRLNDPATSASWALRCFTAPDSPSGDRRARCQAIATALQDFAGKGAVPFRYLDQGVRVGDTVFPALVMGWAEGETLGRWVETHLHDDAALTRAADAVSDLQARLEAAGIAHGDWQHDNLLVGEEGHIVTLVDYDAVLVSGLDLAPPLERGHPNYQHPAPGGENVGRFGPLVIATALRTLACAPDLWDRFGGDGESLLFRAADFADPNRSPVFRAVAMSVAGRDPVIREHLDRLKNACREGGGVLTPLSRRRRRPRRSNCSTDLRTRERVEEEHLLLNRVLGAFALLTMMYVGTATANASLVTLMALPLALCFLLGYLAWPPKKEYDERCRALGRRQIKAAELRHARAHHLASNESEYVLAWLKQVPVGRVIYLPSISLPTLTFLRREQINTAADLRRRQQITGVPAHQMRALLDWCRALEGDARAQYHQLVAPRHGREAELRRLSGALAACEAKIADLEGQIARLPNASLPAYLRRLLLGPN